MAERVFELGCTVAVPPEQAVDFLTDLANHHGLHPFLVAAVVVGQGRSVLGPWQDWRVHERPRLGPLRYSIRFGARLTRTSGTSFTSDVRAAPGCTIEAVTRATPGVEPGTCEIRERSVVRAPVPLLGYMAGQAEAAHRRTMTRLPKVLGADGIPFVN